MGIRHKFASTQPDGTDPSVIRPSSWNDNHNFVPESVTVATNVTWTNMPSAATEMTGNPRVKADLTSADEVRVTVCTGVVGQTGATLKLQYSTDQSTWNDLTPSVAADVLNVVASAWATVPAGAKADVFVRVLGTGGNGVVDPQYRSVNLQVR